MNLQSPWRARSAAVITVMAGAALLATACSGSPASSGSGVSPNAGGANAPIPLAYSRCMRSHGIPDFPDPNGSGQIPKQEIVQLAVSTSVLQRAQQACERLWPYQPPSRAQQRQQLTDDLKFTRCMRSHGLPNFPDPTLGPKGIVFVLSASQLGIDPHSPQLLAKAHACQHVLPAGSPLPSATEAP